MHIQHVFLLGRPISFAEAAASCSRAGVTRILKQGKLQATILPLSHSHTHTHTDTQSHSHTHTHRVTQSQTHTDTQSHTQSRAQTHSHTRTHRHKLTDVVFGSTPPGRLLYVPGGGNKQNVSLLGFSNQPRSLTRSADFSAKGRNSDGTTWPSEDDT